MKSKALKVITAIILALIASCDEPETVVTDIIHADGSITRKIEMTNLEKKFEVHKIQVPIDSTWAIKDSIEINEKGDTTWIRKAEKLFRNANELNMAYAADSGSNKKINRRCEFSRKFRWFNTEYQFAEIIDKEFKYGYPVSDFLDKAELAYFYSPEDVNDKLLKGQDSLKYKAMKELIDKKTANWLIKSAVSEWIGEFTNLTKGRAGEDISFNALKAREDELVRISMENEDHFDSLWKNGILLREFIGEDNVKKFKTEADSSVNMTAERLFVSFNNYTMRIVMPGKLIGTNGIMDSTKTLLWPVKSEYFATEPYQMQAESKESNLWAWIVSGLFLLFVFTGIIFKTIKKG